MLSGFRGLVEGVGEFVELFSETTARVVVYCVAGHALDERLPAPVVLVKGLEPVLSEHFNVITILVRSLTDYIDFPALTLFLVDLDVVIELG